MSDRRYQDENGKLIFHASNLQNYFECPKKYELSTKIDLFEMTDAQRDGLLYEMYLFFNLEKYDDVMVKKLEGRKKSDTLDEIRAKAQSMSDYAQFDGQSFVPLSVDFGSFIIEGEADFIGNCQYRGKTIRCIADAKTTSDVYKLWLSKKTAYDYLQSVLYPMAWWKMTGEVLPFVYYIHDLKQDIKKTVLVKTTEQDFIDMEKRLTAIATEKSWEAKSCYENCIYNRYRTSCKYIAYCQQGAELYAPDEEITYGSLIF